jgi:hypothetical protein
MPSPHCAMSRWCAPQSVIMPPEKSRKSRQLKGWSRLWNGRYGAGPIQRSQSIPAGVSSAGSVQGREVPHTLTRTVWTLPIRPLRTSSQALRNSPEDRCWLPVWKTRAERRAAPAMARAWPIVSESGFSQ